MHLPGRNLEAVLKEDRERLKALQRLQPRFTEGQKQELQEVHPWVRAGGLPAAVDVAVSSLRGPVPGARGLPPPRGFRTSEASRVLGKRRGNTTPESPPGDLPPGFPKGLPNTQSQSGAGIPVSNFFQFCSIFLQNTPLLS